MKFNLKTLIFHPKNIFSNALPADKELKNFIRPVKNACFSFVSPTPTHNPILVHCALEFAKTFELNEETINSEPFLNWVSGKETLPETAPYAMCYGGFQFGHWAGQLGDGRAINLFEIEKNNQLYTFQLKGAGKTPYSRNADGLAVLRSSIREHLCSEAMYYLGVPTSRSLSLCLSGNQVLRDVLYNGNPAYEKGAIVCRVAESFIRFGSFQILAAQNDIDTLKKLADYTIQHFFKDIDFHSEEKYLHFFKTICEQTLQLVVHWQRTGFVHGVLNTDNMSIHGITIDYGPYGWLENFDPNWTPNTTDRENHRYAYGKQAEIIHWNLYQLANALFPLIKEAKGLEEILNNFPKQYIKAYSNMMFEKLGIFSEENKAKIDLQTLEVSLEEAEIDYTIFFRKLSKINKETSDFWSILKDAFYNLEEQKHPKYKNINDFILLYIDVLKGEFLPNEERTEKMNAVNPKYIFRNYMAQMAIEQADEGNYELINTFYNLLQKPYNEQPENEQWFQKRPNWADNKVGCSALSCSS